VRTKRWSSKPAFKQKRTFESGLPTTQAVRTVQGAGVYQQGPGGHWAHDNQVELKLIRPQKPTQTGFIEKARTHKGVSEPFWLKMRI